MPVGPSHGIADVQPAFLWLSARFENHLVEVAVLPDEFHVLEQHLAVGDEDVCSLSQFVLTSYSSSHLQIEQVAPVTAGDADSTELSAKRLQDLLAERGESHYHDDVVWCVINAMFDGRARFGEFPEGEVG